MIFITHENRDDLRITVTRENCKTEKVSPWVLYNNCVDTANSAPQQHRNVLHWYHPNNRHQCSRRDQSPSRWCLSPLSWMPHDFPFQLHCWECAPQENSHRFRGTADAGGIWSPQMDNISQSGLPRAPTAEPECGLQIPLHLSSRVVTLWQAAVKVDRRFDLCQRSGASLPVWPFVKVWNAFLGHAHGRKSPSLEQAGRGEQHWWKIWKGGECPNLIGAKPWFITMAVQQVFHILLGGGDWFILQSISHPIFAINERVDMFLWWIDDGTNRRHQWHECDDCNFQTVYQKHKAQNIKSRTHSCSRTKVLRRMIGSVAMKSPMQLWRSPILVNLHKHLALESGQRFQKQSSCTDQWWGITILECFFSATCSVWRSQ